MRGGPFGFSVTAVQPAWPGARSSVRPAEPGKSKRGDTGTGTRPTHIYLGGNMALNDDDIVTTTSGGGLDGPADGGAGHDGGADGGASTGADGGLDGSA